MRLSDESQRDWQSFRDRLPCLHKWGAWRPVHWISPKYGRSKHRICQKCGKEQKMYIDF